MLSACASYQTDVPIDNIDVPLSVDQAPTRSAAPVVTAVASMPAKVSVLLPLQGDFIKAGKAVRDGYLNAYYQANVSQSVNLTVVDSQKTPDITSLYQQAVATNNPALIVGPLTKADVTTLAKVATLTVPVLALNRAEVDEPVPNNFYQFSLDPQAEAEMVALRLQHDGYHQVYVVAPSGQWGQSIALSFEKAWLALGGAITNSTTYQDSKQFSSQIQTLLAEGMDPAEPRAIFLVGSATDARALVPIIRNQPEPSSIYALPVVYSGVANVAANTVLNGVIFPSTAWQLDDQSSARQSFAALYPDASEDALRLYGFGMDAFALSQYYLTTKSFSGLNITGYSGQLTLGDAGVIERQLLWASFVTGKSQRLRDSGTRS